MPFTIIARMKRNFMFGKMICKILPIVQGRISVVLYIHFRKRIEPNFSGSVRLNF
jgi:hypothetical protein